MTTAGPTGRYGIFCVPNVDGIDRRNPSVDIRYFTFNEARQAHRSTQYGVILSSLDEVLRCAQALMELYEEARKMGLKDLEETIPPLSAKEQSFIDEARKAGT